MKSALCCGKQMGSITLEVPAVSEVGVLTENKMVLNGAYKSCTDPVVDIEYENIDHHDWDDRWLFNKVQLCCISDGNDASTGVTKGPEIQGLHMFQWQQKETLIFFTLILET